MTSRTSRTAAASWIGPAVVVPLVAMGLATTGPASAAPGTEVLLDFGATSVERQSGTSRVRVRGLAAAGGTIADAPGPKGGGRAVRLPAFRTDSSPKAGFSIVPRGEVDELEPRRADFTFGVDFTLDKSSTGSAQDGGNNLVQRGLFDDSAQMKLQVDTGRPSCRIKGSGGVVMLTSQHVVAPNTWYRTWCRRHGDRTTLKVVRLADRKQWTRTVTRDVGALRYGASTPVSVGAKLAGPKRFVRSADQHNGRVDRAFVDIR
jgi:hypothetical protein